MHDQEPKMISTYQDSIWRYFQNRHPDIFKGSAARMNYIIRDISRRKAALVPRVLNIGAGNGYLELSGKKLGWEMASLDPDDGTVKWLREKGIKAHRGCVEDMPFTNEGCDFVIASEVLEHLDDEQLQTGLQEIARVMRKDAWFIGTVPYCEDLASNEVICPRCQEVFHRWGHQRAFDLQSIENLLRCLFTPVVIRRRAFVSFRRKRFVGKLKSIVRLILARYGLSIAVPSLYFVAKK